MIKQKTNTILDIISMEKIPVARKKELMNIPFRRYAMSFYFDLLSKIKNFTPGNEIQEKFKEMLQKNLEKTIANIELILTVNQLIKEQRKQLVAFVTQSHVSILLLATTIFNEDVPELRKIA